MPLIGIRERMGLLEFADLALNLPRDSATMRAFNPHWWVTPEIEFLRAIERQLRVLEWRQTKDGQANPPRKVPQPIPLDAAEDRAQREERGELVSDVMSKDDMARAIGWDD